MEPSRKIDQTIFASDPQRPGNCYAACLATFLGVELEDVPHVVEIGQYLQGGQLKIEDGAPEADTKCWWAMTVGFMAGHGYWPERLADLGDAAEGELVFVGGPGPRGVGHQVIYRDRELWHDPHPSRGGLLSIEIDDLIVWRPLGRFDHAPTAVGT